MKRCPHPGLLLAAVAASALIGLLDRTDALGVPEPAIVNPSWTLDFEFQTPNAVAVEDDDGNVRWYWYLPYKVTNNTGEDRLFAPEIIIYHDNGQIVSAGKNVPPAVFDKVQFLLKNPLLKNSVEIVGKLLKGDDFAKEGAAIWPVTEEDVDAFSVFVGGIYGETQTIENPKTGEEEVLRRTLMLDFEVPGNYRNPQEQPVELVAQRDVMR